MRKCGNGLGGESRVLGLRLGSMALHPARELKIRQPKNFKDYGYGTPAPEGGKKGKNPKMPLEDERPRANVPGYQYVAAPDGQVMLVPVEAAASTEGVSGFDAISAHSTRTLLDANSRWPTWV